MLKEKTLKQRYKLFLSKEFKLIGNEQIEISIKSLLSSHISVLMLKDINPLSTQHKKINKKLLKYFGFIFTISLLCFLYSSGLSSNNSDKLTMTGILFLLLSFACLMIAYISSENMIIFNSLHSNTPILSIDTNKPSNHDVNDFVNELTSRIKSKNHSSPRESKFTDTPTKKSNIILHKNKAIGNFGIKNKHMCYEYQFGRTLIYVYYPNDKSPNPYIYQAQKKINNVWNDIPEVINFAENKLEKIIPSTWDIYYKRQYPEKNLRSGHWLIVFAIIFDFDKNYSIYDIGINPSAKNDLLVYEQDDFLMENPMEFEIENIDPTIHIKVKRMNDGSFETLN